MLSLREHIALVEALNELWWTTKKNSATQPTTDVAAPVTTPTAPVQKSTSNATDVNSADYKVDNKQAGDAIQYIMRNEFSSYQPNFQGQLQVIVQMAYKYKGTATGKVYYNFLAKNKDKQWMTRAASIQLPHLA